MSSHAAWFDPSRDRRAEASARGGPHRSIRALRRLRPERTCTRERGGRSFAPRRPASVDMGAPQVSSRVEMCAIARRAAASDGGLSGRDSTSQTSAGRSFAPRRPACGVPSQAAVPKRQLPRSVVVSLKARKLRPFASCVPKRQLPRTVFVSLKARMGVPSAGSAPKHGAGSIIELREPPSAAYKKMSSEQSEDLFVNVSAADYRRM